MKNLLKYIPGFRSCKKVKIIIASIYYIFCLLTLVLGLGVFLIFFAIPFVIFHAIDVIKNRHIESLFPCLIAILVICIGAMSVPK